MKIPPRFIALIPLSFAVVLQPALATEQSSAGALEDYLKTLAYEPIAFTGAFGHAPLVKGSLSNGRNPVFLVDTGWGMTTLNPNVSVNLKTLGELGVVLNDSMFGPMTNPAIVLMDKLTLGRAQLRVHARRNT